MLILTIIKTSLHRLPTAWLIAIACQSGQLAAQTTHAEDWDTLFAETPYVEAPYYPDDSLTNEISFQPLPDSSTQEGPLNGHWPAYTKNEWDAPNHSANEHDSAIQSPIEDENKTETDGTVQSQQNEFGDQVQTHTDIVPDEKDSIESAGHPPSVAPQEILPPVQEEIPPLETQPQVIETPAEPIPQQKALPVEEIPIPKPTTPVPEPTPTPEPAPVPEKISLPEPTPISKPAPIREEIPLKTNPVPIPEPLPVSPPPAPRSAPEGNQTPAPPRPPTIITPESAAPPNVAGSEEKGSQQKEISISFNNVSMIEFIRFISRISNKNFIFDDEELQFNVTILLEEPTTVENLMTALLQELKIRDLSLIEQGNNIIIHRNPRVRAPARIVSNGTKLESTRDSELVTRVFRLNTLDPVKASEIIKPLLSESALVEVLRDSNNLILTDLVTVVNKIAQLITLLDAPNSGVTIGQYVVRNAFVDSLIDLATKIMMPIAQGNPFVLIPHSVNNSIYVVSNPYIVEKGIAILQNLDLNEGTTKILTLEGLKPDLAEGGQPGNPPPGQRLPGQPPEGFPPPGVGSEGRGSAIFEENRFMPGGIGSATRWSRDLPLGHIERTLFFIYKLRYRKGDQIEIALRKIAGSLQLMGTANVDLVSAINSSQWIESSNALIFTGTSDALEKVRELILEVDVPLRQVFIEMLILDASITDSLTYGVDWINRFGGGGTTGEQGVITSVPANHGFTFNVNNPLHPTSGNPTIGGANSIINSTGPLGYTAGVIGTHLTHGGTHFSTIGALVRAIHSDSKTNIILNPKIITEDNTPAEIFVGETDRYKTQSLSNDLGTIITNNFQFIDVGTTLRVTPLIGNHGVITLDIIQETTAGVIGANTGGNQQDVNLVPVLTKSRTVTKIHVPNGFFAILSGQIRDEEHRGCNRVPCLGAIPIIGALNKRQTNIDNKRNLMLFIRPLIIDTDDELEDITKRQQDVYREKSKFRRSWNYEIDEALNFFNVKPTDPDEIPCNER